MDQNKWTLEDLLELHELTQTDLAELIGCHFTTVSGWINGGNMSPTGVRLVLALFNVQEHEVQFNVASWAARELGSVNPELPPQSQATIEARRGHRRTPETIERMRRAQQLRKRRQVTTVTTVTEEWFD